MKILTTDELLTVIAAYSCSKTAYLEQKGKINFVNCLIKYLEEKDLGDETEELILKIDKIVLGLGEDGNKVGDPHPLFNL